jgi:hypothetical protein
MKFKFFFVSRLFVSIKGFSQTSQTPYSSKGIGDVIYPGTISNIGMGGITIAYPSSYNFNPSKPALLSFNNFTTVEVGFTGERKAISNGSLTHHNGSGNLNYLSISFPVKNGFWSSGLSLGFTYNDKWFIRRRIE